MPLLDEDDLKELFDTDEGAVEAYYTPVGKGGKKIPSRFPYEGDFEEASIDPYKQTDDNPDLMALVITEDVSPVKHKSTFKVDGTTYNVRRGKGLRSGLTILYLYE